MRAAIACFTCTGKDNRLSIVIIVAITGFCSSYCWEDLRKHKMQVHDTHTSCNPLCGICKAYLDRRQIYAFVAWRCGCLLVQLSHGQHITEW